MTFIACILCIMTVTPIENAQKYIVYLSLNPEDVFISVLEVVCLSVLLWCVYTTSFFALRSTRGGDDLQ